MLQCSASLLCVIGGHLERPLRELVLSAVRAFHCNTLFLVGGLPTKMYSEPAVGQSETGVEPGLRASQAGAFSYRRC